LHSTCKECVPQYQEPKGGRTNACYQPTGSIYRLTRKQTRVFLRWANSTAAGRGQLRGDRTLNRHIIAHIIATYGDCRIHSLATAATTACYVKTDQCEELLKTVKNAHKAMGIHWPREPLTTAGELRLTRLTRAELTAAVTLRHTCLTRAELHTHLAQTELLGRKLRSTCFMPQPETCYY
jgi:hypothetical protein